MAPTRCLCLVAALILTVPRTSPAQTPDFLFGPPRGTVAVRTGWMVARAGSDIYTFVEDQLTLKKKDFNAPSAGVALDFALSPRLSAVAGFDFNGSTTQSEYRRLVDNDRQPIKQTTTLRQQNIGIGLKFALTPRGQAISEHAWIPAAITPFMGADAGATHYKFSQDGDFVDFVDGSVFPHRFQSSGWAPSARAFGGIDVKASRRIYFSGEAGYLWSHATLDGDFSGFNPIDLAGFTFTGGVRCIF